MTNLHLNYVCCKKISSYHTGNKFITKTSCLMLF